MSLKTLAFAVLVGWLLAGPISARAEGGDPIPGQFLVIFKHGVPPGPAAEALARAHGLEVRHVYRHALGGMAVRVPAGHGLGPLAADARVAAVGPDRTVRAIGQVLPKGIDRVDAEPAARPNAGAGVRVAVIDTGIDMGHADLPGVDPASSVTCFLLGCFPGGRDDNGHGTFVSGVIGAADNGIDTVGVGPSITLVSVKVLGADGSGAFSDVIAGVDHLTGLAPTAAGVDVANMSLGASCSVCTDDSADPTVAAFHTAIRSLVAAGTTVVAAAGNDAGDAANAIPASFDEVVTVSALADWDGRSGGDGPTYVVTGMGKVKDDSFAKFSNYGADVDVIAPGLFEVSLALGGGTAEGSGTSFAAPHAAGVAALFVRTRLDATGVAPDPATVRWALIQTGECAQGSATATFGADGCSRTWSGDPDGVGEPLVNAANLALFDPALTEPAPSPGGGGGGKGNKGNGPKGPKNR
jgi:subtilisin